MEIKFTDYFRNEAANKFGIRPAHVENLIRNSDKSQNVILEGRQELRFYAKEIQLDSSTYVLLAYGRLVNNEFNVDMAFKFFSDLFPNIEELQPVQILHDFANIFGLEVKIGMMTSKFIFNQTIIIEQGEAAKLVSVENPLNHSFTQSMFIKQSSEEDKIKVDCALAFCIDTIDYLNYLRKH